MLALGKLLSPGAVSQPGRGPAFRWNKSGIQRPGGELGARRAPRSAAAISLPAAHLPEDGVSLLLSQHSKIQFVSCSKSVIERLTPKAVLALA